MRGPVKMFIAFLFMLIAFNLAIYLPLYWSTVDLRKTEARQEEELRVLRNMLQMYEEKINYLTHPATIQDRTIDYFLKEGEFRE